MIKVNDNFHELADMYLFSEVGKRVRNFRESHPTTDVVRMDIGDVTLPMFVSHIQGLWPGTGLRFYEGTDIGI